MITMEIDYNQIGQRMKQIRTAPPKVSRAAVAEYVGVTDTAIYKWENGIDKPGLPYIAKVAEFFKVKVSTLLGEVPDKMIIEMTPQNIRSLSSEISTEVFRNLRPEIENTIKESIPKSSLNNRVGLLPEHVVNTLSRLDESQVQELSVFLKSLGRRTSSVKKKQDTR
jgi:transcriptional regulator with XRE-family HTH domain